MKITLCEVNRCTLRCNFCISDKSDLPFGQVFTLENFGPLIDKLVQLGYDQFDLTPQIGDILTNSNCLKFFEYLENHQDIISYGFSTHFLFVPKEFENFLFNSKKLYLDISVYGWDSKSYLETTNKDKFNQFYKNLEVILFSAKSIGKKLSNLNLYNRTEFSFIDFPTGKLLKLIKDMKSMDATVVDETENCNWGGYKKIGDKVDKKGVCKQALTGNGVFPNGDITLCGCWDTYGKMVYSNIFKDNKINNETYKSILKNQLKNNYTSLCQSCNDFEPADIEMVMESLNKNG